jgi:hypothetical protein
LQKEVVMRFRYLSLALATVLGLVSCVAEADEPYQNVQSEIRSSELQPQEDFEPPPPAPGDLLLQQGSVTPIPPPQRACTDGFAIVNGFTFSAVIRFSGTLNKRPKLVVHRLNAQGEFERVFFARIVANDGESFSVTIFGPGIYSVCIRNPAPNNQTIFIHDAAVQGF